MSMSYGQMRLAWCQAAMRSLLQRWGVYMGVGLLVLGGGGQHALTAMAALAAWAVLPLLQAAQHGLWVALAATLGYGLAGAMLVWGLSPVLWPRRWALAERALPVRPRARRRSDLTVVLLGLTPLFGVYVAGAVVWAAQAPGWLREVWGQALVLLGASAALSVSLGVGILEWRRSVPVHAASTQARRPTALKAQDRHMVSVARALLWLPLRRGPAQRAGRFMAVCLLAALVCAASLAYAPGQANWWLAAFAALTQTLTTRLYVLVRTELGALHAACAALAVPPNALQRSRYALALFPMLLGTVLMACTLLSQGVQVHTAVFTTYVLAVLGGNTVLVLSAPSQPDAPPAAGSAARISWWLLVLVVQVALASEVLP
ncbi:MAG: hypothetical protein Q8R67_03665 [Rhodoferax sp.]|nr:hypothetical protein [Rhodoferax sp.]MDP3650761.1 hypothetical protein [Rhodoferax sp.]